MAWRLLSLLALSGVASALPEAPSAHGLWAAQLLGMGATEAEALLDSAHGIESRVAIWRCGDDRALFKLGDKKRSFHCPEAASNLTVADVTGPTSFTADYQTCTGDHKLDITPLSSHVAASTSGSGALQSVRMQAICSGAGGSGRSLLHKPGMTAAAAEGWIYALYGQLDFFDGYSTPSDHPVLQSAAADAPDSELMMADVTCGAHADTLAVYENDGDGDFKLHVNLRCKVAAMQLAARQPLQVDTLDARSLMQQVERARGALALEAKAAALAAGSRVVSAGRAAQSLDRARRDAPDIAGTLDNVKCSMPLTLAGATGVATGAQSPTEPKVKFTSNCYCNGDEVDCASMTPCKGKGTWVYTNHAEDTSAQSGLELEACMDLSLACRGTIVFGVFGCDGKMTYETVGHAKAKGHGSRIATGRLAKVVNGKSTAKPLSLKHVSGLLVIHEGESEFDVTFALQDTKSALDRAA